MRATSVSRLWRAGRYGAKDRDHLPRCLGVVEAMRRRQRAEPLDDLERAARPHQRIDFVGREAALARALDEAAAASLRIRPVHAHRHLVDLGDRIERVVRFAPAHRHAKAVDLAGPVRLVARADAEGIARVRHLEHVQATRRQVARDAAQVAQRSLVVEQATAATIYPTSMKRFGGHSAWK